MLGNSDSVDHDEHVEEHVDANIRPILTKWWETRTESPLTAEWQQKQVAQEKLGQGSEEKLKANGHQSLGLRIVEGVSLEEAKRPRRTRARAESPRLLLSACRKTTGVKQTPFWWHLLS